MDMDFVVMPKLNSDSGNETKKNFPQQPLPGSKRTKAIMAGILTVVILGVLGYGAYVRFFRAAPETPKVNITAPTSTRPELDSDRAGLTDDTEKTLGTNASKADTDNDGLADGDESHVYGSDPLLPDTDGDSYDDGQEEARGYSPIANSPNRAGVDEQQKWLKNSVDFGLHEPTLTTLKAKVNATQPSQTAAVSENSYINKIYGYTIVLPEGLHARERNSGQEVGIYIGIAETQQIDADPITITLAGRTANALQTLRAWAETNFPADTYDSLIELNINSQNAVQLKGLKSEGCSQNITFFLKNGNALALTLNCLEGMTAYYNQILNSFKFQ